jgi:ATP-dependent HslUV protease subunit HslV
VLQSAFSKLEDVKLGSRMEVYETFRRLHPVLKEHAFLNPKEDEDDPYESSQIQALIANSSGIYGVYSYREVFEFDRFWAAGSGRSFALGAMHALYESELSSGADRRSRRRRRHRVRHRLGATHRGARNQAGRKSQ